MELIKNVFKTSDLVDVANSEHLRSIRVWSGFRYYYLSPLYQDVTTVSILWSVYTVEVHLLRACCVGSNIDYFYTH